MDATNTAGQIAPPSTHRLGNAGFTAVLAAFAGLMFGLDIGVISGALGLIAEHFHASEVQQEWIVSSMMFGAAIGALVAGRLSWRFGRKWTLFVAACLFVTGAVLCGFAWSIPSLIVARCVLGLAIGIAAFTAPLYISEIADRQRRGALISTYQLMITIGILLAFISDAVLSYYGAWRWMLGIVAVPGLVFLICVLFLPYSPRWLVMRGNTQGALAVLTHLRGSADEAGQELGEIQRQLSVKQQGLTLFRTNSNFRRSVWLGIVLQVVQQLTGINVVMYYAPRIFALAGFGQHAQMWGTAIVGAMNVAATFIAIGVVDRWGRRPVLIAGFAIMAVGMGALGIAVSTASPDTFLRGVAVTALLCFIAGFACSAGPLIWVLCSEIQPLQGRDFGISASTFTNWAANMVVGATFLTMLTTLGNSTTFGLYAVMNAAFIALTLYFIPETKGISLEDIEENLMDGLPLRQLGQPRPR